MIKYSEKYFEELVISNPNELLELIKSNKLENSLLTFAVEIAGKYIHTNECFNILISLLNHESAIVKEGIIYGLLEFYEIDCKTNFFENKNKIIYALEKILNNEKSVILVSLIKDTIKNLKLQNDKFQDDLK